MARLTPHQKIMAAAGRMRGVRLTAEEVTKLARDNAIQAAAQSDAEQAAERDALTVPPKKEQAHG